MLSLYLQINILNINIEGSPKFFFSFEQLEKTGAKIICIASGGKVIAKAKEAGYDYIQVPGDWPSPRACLGFSLVQQIFVLEKLGFIGSTISSQINIW